MPHAGGHAGLRLDEQQLSLEVFTLVLALSVWQATGSLVLGAVDGGPHPSRRLLIGVLLVAVTAVTLWRRRAVCACLRARPWLVVPVAIAYLSAAALDGLLPSGHYLALSTVWVGLAAFIMRPRMVWLIVIVLQLCYVLAILVEQSPAQLVDRGLPGAVLGGLLDFAFVALTCLAVVRLFGRFMSRAEPILEATRDGAPALTPALTLAIQRGSRALGQLPAPLTAAELTPTERRVVEGLGGGSTPKQLAQSWGVSISTVRTHIRHAKRKTHARTLAELSGIAARADWPEPGDRGG